MSEARPPRLAWVAALLAFLAPFGAAPPSRADHVTATVSASATLGKAVRTCDDEGDFCARGRRISISWQASCGPAAPPDALEAVDVSTVGIRPDGTRFTLETVMGSPQPSGSENILTAGPGLRLVGEVTVTCRTFTPGSPDHVSTASASSMELYLPPQVKTARTVFPITISCRRIPTSKLDRWLQAGRRALLTWQLSYDEASLLAPGIPKARQIKLFARGAGIRLSSFPNRTMLRRYHGVIGVPLTPRRAGTLRIWAMVNGHRTDTVAVKVLPC